MPFAFRLPLTGEGGGEAEILFKTMKNLKYMSLMLALLCVVSFGFISCGSDDDDDDDTTPAPTIVMGEANIEDGEICVKADVNAPGRTKAIQIVVTDASGKTIKATKNVTDSKYIGVLNIDGFHVHVDIADKGVVAGDLLQLTVTDGNSKSTTAQKSITEEEDED